MPTSALPLDDLHADVVGDAAALEPWRPAWDALAAEARRPFCSSAWMLAWWRRVAPADAALRTIVVRRGGTLVGLAPMFARRSIGLVRYDVLGAGTSFRAEPLARAGLEREVGRAVAGALASTTPRPDRVELRGVIASSPWAAGFARGWSRHVDTSRAAPTLDLRARTFEEWFASRSHGFRKHLRRARRELERAGASFRLAATREDVRRGVDALARLHRARWAERGGSSVLDERVERMLVDAGEAMLDGGFRLWLVELASGIVSAHLFVAAGGEVSYWLGGFDDAWAAQSPGLVTMLAAAEDAWARGDERIDLGGGAQDYKIRFADGEDRLEWITLVPPGPRAVLTRASLVPKRAYRALPDAARERIRLVAARAASLRRSRP